MRHFILIVENDGTPTGFSPIQGEDGFYEYSSDSVFAVLSANFESRICSIHEFTSNFKGGGRLGLQELRSHFDHVDVIDIGMEPEEASWMFWAQMKQEGLVENIYPDSDSSYDADGHLRID